MSETFKSAMEQAFIAGITYEQECERGTTPGGGTDFEEWFASFMKEIETKAREAYEAPIRLTPTVTLPGPNWNDLDEKVRNAFRIPPEMIGMDFGTEPPVVAVNDWPDDVREDCDECGQRGIPVTTLEGVEKCPWCGAIL